MSGLHDFVLPLLEGPPLRLAAWAGAPVLVVQIPDRGGLGTPARALEAFWQRFRERGLRVIGLPSSPFAPDRHGSAPDLASLRHGFGFPIAAPIELAGAARHPLARWLCGSSSPFPGDPRADFEKFLCDGRGRLVARYPGALGLEAPELVAAVEMLLP